VLGGSGRILRHTPKPGTPSLLDETLPSRALILALFGGQGINEIYFDELQTLFDTYRPSVELFLASIIDEVLQPLASASQGTAFYEHGLNAISWLTGAVPLPPVGFFASVLVSFPRLRPGVISSHRTHTVHSILGCGPRVWSITCGAVTAFLWRVWSLSGPCHGRCYIFFQG
jgi:hypothetical protein